MIPIGLNVDLLNIWNWDRKALINFIKRFSKGKDIKKWRSSPEPGFIVD